MTARSSACLAIVFAFLGCPAMALADAITAKASTVSGGHITGIGGVFFKSKDPKALAAWYRDVLGVQVEDWGGAALRYDAPGHPPILVWSPFPETTDYMAPSTRDFMVNFAVDDLDDFLVRLAGKGVSVLRRDDTDPNGKFAWILDPDGTKIELWEPRKP